jgi:hypothetical protein
LLRGRRGWITARALATLGAALFAIGAWGPWILMAFSFDGDASHAFSTQLNGGMGLMLFLGLAGFQLPGALFYPLSFTWGAVTLAGILLCPVLWQSLRRRALHVTSLTFSLWLLVATTVSTIAANALLRDVLRPLPYQPLVVQWRIGWGFWLAVLGLVLAWGATVMLRGEVRRSADLRYLMTGSEARRSPLQLAGAALVSAGALVWALGFLALPWATVNCTSLTFSLNHYVHGSCAGLDAADALSAFIYGHQRIDLSSFAASPSELGLIVYGLLAGGAMLVIIGCWRRALTQTLCAWLSLWLVLAFAIALVALSGARTLRAIAPILASDAIGAWVLGPGIFVCFAGLALVAGGLILLWRHTWQVVPAPKEAM